MSSWIGEKSSGSDRARKMLLKKVKAVGYHKESGQTKSFQCNEALEFEIRNLSTQADEKK